MRNTIRWDGTSPITVLDLDQTCTFQPTQWEGRTAHGDSIYFRFRSGRFSIALWATDEGDDWTDIYEHASETGEWGSMTWDELWAATPDWITLPAEAWTP